MQIHDEEGERQMTKENEQEHSGDHEKARPIRVKNAKDFKVAFGTYVRQAREAKGMSSRRLASEAGLDPAYLSKIERGEFAPPGEEKIIALAQKLDINEDELLAEAGRLKSDLATIIFSNPPVFAAVIRMIRGCSPDQVAAIMGFARHFQVSEEGTSEENDTP